MKKLLFAVLLIFATISSVFAMNYDEAKLQDKPVVVMFHMHGCGACKQFSPMFDKIAAKFSDKFNFIKEDSQSSDIARTLNFQTVPAVFIIQPKTMQAQRINDDCAWDDQCFAQTLKDYK